MLTWVLILVIYGGDMRPAITSVEFMGERACIMAGEAAQKRFSRASYVCVPLGA